MNNELVEKLKWIRSEVLALKQAHEYGLNAFDFYTKTVSIETPPISIEPVELRLTIKYGNDVSQLPFQILKLSQKEVFGITWNNNTHEYIIAYSEYNLASTTHTAYLITTKPIVSMELIKL